MKEIDPVQTENRLIAAFLLQSVVPRPIAFASTVDAAGNPNLAPFSYFNAFGSNPPILVFSPSRRGRDNSTKHTFENVRQVPEVVINMVNYPMVEQMNLASADFPAGVSEFEKAGFTTIPSSRVRPFRVKGSPVQFECRVNQVIELGTGGGAGNLVVCEVLLIHVDEEVLDGKGNIIPDRIDMVGRLGGDLYVRASGPAVFRVKKPGLEPGIGIDSLPEHIRNSDILTGNDLGRLGMLPALPSREEVGQSAVARMVDSLRVLAGPDEDRLEDLKHQLARDLIAEDRPDDALKVLLSD